MAKIIKHIESMSRGFLTEKLTLSPTLKKEMEQVRWREHSNQKRTQYKNG